jgi:L-alanine-DL-glutamate epimerase-like enolase superfamily enzyme
MLRTLTARHDRFGLNAPFRISRGVRTEADVVTVTIRQGEHVGRGEGVPISRYNETIENSLAAVAELAPLIETGATRADLAAAVPANAARAAVDNALWDLEARLAGTTVAALAGVAEPGPVPTAITISIDTPEAMAAAAAPHANVPLLKVKVDREDPQARIAAIRSVAPMPRLIVDANESWTIAEVVALQDFLIELRVDLLEQPLPAAEDEALARIQSRVPICADESLHTRADLDRLVGRYSHVNIKLDKTGGLTEALALADAARGRGFGLMVGCMVCSSLGIAPAMLVAAGAEFADLDGPLWLSADREGGARAENGILLPPAAGFWGTPE